MKRPPGRPPLDHLIDALRTLAAELREQHYVDGVLVRWAGYDGCRYYVAEQIDRLIDEATADT